ncbi:ferredoxin [Pseudooceanicola sp. HF7]|uniref:ferredoxin n=1 Tax=Pseudooceanicola sp. HF7 TaxID=2721560 RepID=UPI0034C5E1F5
MPSDGSPAFHALQAEAKARNLTILCAMGEAACADAPGLEPGTRTLLLLSPLEPDFYEGFEASDEMLDGRPDPYDRYTLRIVGKWADEIDAMDYYPFDTAQPFLAWAKASGGAHGSPVGMLAHREAGLWLSFRAALALDWAVGLPPPLPSPCAPCPAPCATACPVGALTQRGYDTERCKDWLSRPEGRDCMTYGCLVRHACPFGQGYPRLDRQSAFHMRAFRRN